jgi:hypothetical protein
MTPPASLNSDYYVIVMAAVLKAKKLLRNEIFGSRRIKDKPP